jgi:alkylation response protein AidB-like acyl-CoA dehydrogenase
MWRSSCAVSRDGASHDTVIFLQSTAELVEKFAENPASRRAPSAARIPVRPALDGAANRLAKSSRATYRAADRRPDRRWGAWISDFRTRPGLSKKVGRSSKSLPADIRDKVKGDLPALQGRLRRWHKILAKKDGWCQVASARRNRLDAGAAPIFRKAGARLRPRLVAFGIRWSGRSSMHLGSKRQKEHYLPRILSQEDFWCQGYSEPGSGSDLASLKTRAVREDDHFVVNGQKTWTTMAHFADRMFCLCRTNSEAKFQEGISFLLVDMKQPGVEVKPIRTMDGGHEVNTVYLTDVKVPIEDRVGEENEGWTYAKFLLSHERSGIARIGASKAQLDKLREIARHERCGDGYLIDDEDFKRAVAQVVIDLHTLENTELRALTAAAKGERRDRGERAQDLRPSCSRRSPSC